MNVKLLLIFIIFFSILANQFFFSFRSMLSLIMFSISLRSFEYFIAHLSLNSRICMWVLKMTPYTFRHSSTNIASCFCALMNLLHMSSKFYCLWKCFSTCYAVEFISLWNSRWYIYWIWIYVFWRNSCTCWVKHMFS